MENTEVLLEQLNSLKAEQQKASRRMNAQSAKDRITMAIAGKSESEICSYLLTKTAPQEASQSLKDANLPIGSVFASKLVKSSANLDEIGGTTISLSHNGMEQTFPIGNNIARLKIAHVGLVKGDIINVKVTKATIDGNDTVWFAFLDNTQWDEKLALKAGKPAIVADSLLPEN